MIDLNIPGRGSNLLDHLVCDVNGTLIINDRLGLRSTRIPPGDEAQAKADHVRR